jgi:hypothetical protein
MNTKWIGGLATIAMPLLAAIPARPGMLNYVEGRVTVGGQELASNSVGSAALGAGETLRTNKGRAEILLSPGLFLRVDDNSAVRMDSAGLTDTRVELLQGRAMLEADNLQNENNVTVAENGAAAHIEKNGLYRFDADRPLIAVYDGKANVQTEGGSVDVKGGRALALNETAPLKAEKFNKDSSEDDFYKWSKLRSEYVAEANAASAPVFAYANTGWYGPGWYWNPWYSSYTFIPGAGVMFSPFGWGFGSPAAFYGGYYGPIYGYGRRPVIIRRSPVVVAPRQGVPATGTPRGTFSPGINPGMRSGVPGRVGRMH